MEGNKRRALSGQSVAGKRSLVMMCSMLLTAVTLWFGGRDVLVPVLMLLPILCGTLSCMCLPIALGMAWGCMMISVALLTGWAAWALPLWCGLVLAWTILRSTLSAHALRWATGYGVLSVVLLCMGLAAMLQAYDGHVVPGAAQAIIDRLDGQPNANAILLRLWQRGFASLTGNAALLPGLNVGGTVILPDTTRLELLYSLRTNLEDMLMRLLPRWSVLLPAWTVLLTAFVPDMWLKRRGKCEHPLPSATLWHMPRGMGLRVAVLWLAALLPYVTNDAVMVYFGLMCGTLCTFAYTLQGACFAYYLMEQRNMRPATRWAQLAVLTVLLRPVLILLGCLDQWEDLRGVREPMEREDDES